MHTNRGFDYFLKRNSDVNKQFKVDITSTFDTKFISRGGSIKKEVLPNGVTRLQLPRDAFATTKKSERANTMVNGERLQGVKTLWPDKFSIEDIAQAASEIVAKYPDLPTDKSLTGTFKGIKIEVWLDKSTKKVKTAYPAWIQ